jgi:hypothetical protein
MTLPLAQSRVLRFVADTGQVTDRDAARALRMARDTTRNALTLLAGKGLLDADRSTVPVSYTVTHEGLKVLAEDGA